MTEALLGALISRLQDAGLRTLRQFPEDAPPEELFVCAGIRESRLVSAGAGDYMGLAERGGRSLEVFGYRAEADIALDLYCPAKIPAAASLCREAAERVIALSHELPSGLRLRSVSCGDEEFLAATDLFRLPLSLSCLAFLTRERDEETGVFTDFTLKGVLK